MSDMVLLSTAEGARAYLPGMLAPLLRRIGLGALFQIRPRRIDCAVGPGGDPAGGNRLADRCFRDATLRGIASPGHSHSDRNLIYSVT